MMTNEEFSALAQQHMAMVYRVALNCVKTPEDADDVTQNVMLRLYRAGPSFESGEHARRWLIRVAVNESKRLLTTPWRRRTVALDQITQQQPASAGTGSQLLELVRALPQKYRLPLYLYYYEDYSVEEISAILGRGVSTVQTQLARGRQKLKQMLTEETQDGEHA